MSRLANWILFLLLLFITGCSKGSPGDGVPKSFPLARVVEETESSVTLQDLTGDGTFDFAMGIGSGREGYNLLQVDKDRKATYEFKVNCQLDGDGPAVDLTPQWRRTEFTVPETVVADLRKVLADTNFPKWKREYHATVDDGTQVIVKVIVDDSARKATYFNNHFPDTLQRVRSFVDNQILEPNADAIRGAAQLEPDERTMISPGF